MGESPVEESVIKDIVESLKDYYSSLGANIIDGEGILDFIVEYSLGVTRLRIGFIIASTRDPFSYLGRAYSAWREGLIDKAVVVSPDDIIARKMLSPYKFIEVVSGSDLEIFVKGHEKHPRGRDHLQIHLEPAISKDDVLALAEKHRGRILKRGEFIGALLGYIQLYCFEVDIHTIDYVDEILEHTTASLCFDSITGSLVYFDDGLRVSGDWQGLAQLSGEAVSVLKRIAELGEASIAELKEEMGGDVDVDSIIEVLVEKKLVEPAGVDIYVLSEPPLNIAMLEDEIEKEYKSLIKRGKPRCNFIFPPRVNVYSLVRILSAFGSVKRHKTIYYPLLVMIYRKQVKDRDIEVTLILDALTKKRLAEVEELLGESLAVAYIDTMVEYVKKHRGVLLCSQIQNNS